jgi:hypothetical protein
LGPDRTRAANLLKININNKKGPVVLLEHTGPEDIQTAIGTYQIILSGRAVTNISLCSLTSISGRTVVSSARCEHGCSNCDDSDKQ